MRSDELSLHDLCALSFQGSNRVCSGGIADLPVAGCMWTTGHAVHSNVLNSTVSPIFKVKKSPVANIEAFYDIILLCKTCLVFLVVRQFD